MAHATAFAALTVCHLIARKNKPFSYFAGTQLEIKEGKGLVLDRACTS